MWLAEINRRVLAGIIQSGPAVRCCRRHQLIVAP